ncbi:MAG: aminotransferase DegT [Candidatus Lambdaproteobacteria bacterium RIFOXYD2_FULL_50_16]|uniref:Aminotransferase DegT n=1 Tax=Candidatus Lambdaproteobacteria bacterium RIFOXYD2_FULL_50_16 TaxID=1817772 RepID=A0A1F6G848_9PROT|nr:MAG: aminotransferase DegT [Candidatus Lambdaproteobacteria bacterium RIFOXYD2_FULL_50_16]
MSNQTQDFIAFVKQTFGSQGLIPLHAPNFEGREKELVAKCIESTFVSSVGPEIVEFEKDIARYVGAKHAVAVVNGTQGLQVALRLAGVKSGDEVITQALSFAATCNSIHYLAAHPVFLDVEESTLGLCPAALTRFLEEETLEQDGARYNRKTGRRIAAVVPMHTLGFPAKISLIKQICSRYQVPLVEDAAESLGSFFEGKHTGTFGLFGVFSFNGNKIITTGGGGMIVTDDPELAKAAKHLTTTAKVPHTWEFFHDQLGYNFRMPNLNAALGRAQMERLEGFVQNKRQLASLYQTYAKEHGLHFVKEPKGSLSNYWLNALLLDDLTSRDAFLATTNQAGVMTRPLWTPLNRLPYNQNCQTGPLPVTQNLYERLVNIPSSVRL